MYEDFGRQMQPNPLDFLRATPHDVRGSVKVGCKEHSQCPLADPSIRNQAGGARARGARGLEPVVPFVAPSLRYGEPASPGPFKRMGRHA